VLQRLGAILGAEVVVFVYAPNIVGIVIQQIVGAVGHDQTHTQQEPDPMQPEYWKK
jgi:hypothetical protein